MKKKIKIVLSLIFIIINFGCSTTKEITKQQELIIYPKPPEVTRIQYLTSFSTSSDIVPQQSEFFESIIGKKEDRTIIKPYGISIYKGKIYICDTMLGGLVVVDLNSSTFEYFIPKGLGELKKPINCFIDKPGKLYIADAERQQIVVFDKSGNYLNAFGLAEQIKPTDVFVEDNKIWVTDLMKHKIAIYNQSDFSLITTFPKDDTDSLSRLFSPTNLFISENEVYVSDFGAFNVKVYDKAGNYKRTVGSYGRNLGQFVRQKGIAVDKENNLYVVDAGFENVQIFNNKGQLLMFFGGSYKGPGDMWLPAKVIIDYDNLNYFQKYVHESFDLKYLIFVTNQYGPSKINIYGFVETK
ncbi:MAG: hypothetical protein KDC88_01250 [Ignavibacteriae bacterium]|nr:hypothetical protein [Ignavibacteriota bacterium]MCB9208258.1 hypothetical protein [Ignavibacteriales bacterium]MCB9259020.1 hypothetical protein [Ignavibacteriales bacterium]